MKKIISIALVMFLLVGCSTDTSQRIAEPEVLYTFNGKTVTTNDVLDRLISSDPGTILVNELEDTVIAQLRAEKPFDTTELVKNQLASIKASLADNYDSYMAQNYGSEEAFIKDVLDPQMYLQLYFNDALTTGDMEAVKKEYDLKSVKVYLFSTEEEAKAVKDQYKTAGSIEALEKVIKANGSTTIIASPNSTVYAEEMLDVLKGLKSTGDVASYADTANSYYYAFIVTDDEISADRAIATLLNQTNYIDVEMGKIIKAKGFKIKDAKLNETFKEKHPTYVD